MILPQINVKTIIFGDGFEGIATGIEGMNFNKIHKGIHIAIMVKNHRIAEYRGHQIIGFFCQFIQAKIGTIPFKHGKFNVVTATNFVVAKYGANLVHRYLPSCQ